MAHDPAEPDAHDPGRRVRRTLIAASWGLAVVALVAFVGLAPWRTRAPQGSTVGPVALVGDVPNPDAAAEQPVDATGLPVLWDAPAFALTDEAGRPFGAADLRGDVYAVSFFFTECTGVCPMITQRMAGLQSAVPDGGVKLVSITVDPTNDSEGVLSRYAEKVGADGGRWHFLTGAPDQVSAVASGFKLPYDDPTKHAAKILLVDAEGRVRGYYDAREASEAANLARDARALAAVAQGRPVPTDPDDAAPSPVAVAR